MNTIWDYNFVLYQNDLFEFIDQWDGCWVFDDDDLFIYLFLSFILGGENMMVKFGQWWRWLIHAKVIVDVWFDWSDDVATGHALRERRCVLSPMYDREIRWKMGDLF